MSIYRSELRRAFNLLAPAEIALALAQDSGFRLPPGSENPGARMAAAHRLIRYGSASWKYKPPVVVPVVFGDVVKRSTRGAPLIALAISAATDYARLRAADAAPAEAEGGVNNALIRHLRIRRSRPAPRSHGADDRLRLGLSAGVVRRPCWHEVRRMSKSARQIEIDIRSLLSSCSGPARGVWHEARYQIEEHSDRPGHLQRNGRPSTDGQLALVAGYASSEVAHLLQELEACGLLMRSEGVLHSPLLARAAQQAGRVAVKQKRYRDRQRLNGGNVIPTVTPSVTGALPLDPSPLPSPAPSPSLTLSPSTSPSPIPAPQSAAPAVLGGEEPEKTARKRKPAEPIAIPAKLTAVPEFVGQWERWLRYRRTRGLTCTPETINAQLRKLDGIGPERAIAAIDVSIESGWQGVFERRDHATRGPNGKRNERDAAGARAGEFTEKPGILEQYAQQRRTAAAAPSPDRAAG